MTMEWYLPVIWSVLIGTAVAMYVFLDGFDLGIGILFPFAQDDGERDQMITSVAPFWDGNETWLVLGGGGLLVAFPAAYAVVMPAFYIPVIVMLLALVLRGVTFEFRTISHHKWRWNVMFALGSTLAAFCQGIILGSYVEGIPIANGQFAGGAFDWARPFGVVCGLGMVAGYALLGATWLVMKTEGPLAERSRVQARVLLIVVLGFMAAVSLWTPLEIRRIGERWFSLPNILFLWPVPLVTLAVAVMGWRWLGRGHTALPFLSAMLLFLLGYLGLAISTFPYIAPPSLTIWDAAAAPASQIFMLIGTLFLLPIILGYTGFIYYLFRGKVKPGESYH
jgi:cytochrome d ubiquinol oxidase subunit II